MRAPRWIAVSPFAFEWEREALDFTRTNLPDYEPWHAWSNFEFIDDEGRVNEMDLLVLTPAELVLVKIKSRPTINPSTAQRVVLRGSPGSPDDAGIAATLLRADELGLGRRGTVDANSTRGSSAR